MSSDRADRSNLGAEIYYFNSLLGDAVPALVLPEVGGALPAPRHQEVAPFDKRYIYLDSLSCSSITVGYGEPGFGGSLGYEGRRVSSQGVEDPHAISAHPPSSAAFTLDGGFVLLECSAAINAGVGLGITSAHFSVFADGRLVGSAVNVHPGEAPRRISADVRHAKVLELVVETSQWNFCHAVWLNPKLLLQDSDVAVAALTDSLGRTDIILPVERPKARRCIATVASKGFEPLLDDMLGSLVSNGGCPDALIVVFCAGDDSTLAPIAAKYGAFAIRCSPKRPVGLSLKCVLYSVASVIDADQFLCLDSDMLVLADVSAVFAAIDACPENAILACPEDNRRAFRNLGDAFHRLYHGTPAEAASLLERRVADYPLVVNDGLFAGGRRALLELDSGIRDLPDLQRWMDERPDVGYRNQFIFNAALAKLECGAELSPVFNLQLNRASVRMFGESGRPQAEWSGRRVAVVHFNGNGRNQNPEWRGLYSRIPDPLVGPSPGDAYQVFLSKLRAWCGLYGQDALSRSFCGTPDGQSARVWDVSTVPVLALLHYLIRANGCARVLETGTARGVSAACMASAVAHRPGGRVVTFDPNDYPEREPLWFALPEKMRSCIEPRRLGSLEGMAAALESGESFQAALLDSLHTAEHVWSEFQLARQLVCPGGLILVHNVAFERATVAEAVNRIQAAGYGVARLWTAQAGVPEDSNLGLAVIENRVYPG